MTDHHVPATAAPVRARHARRRALTASVAAGAAAFLAVGLGGAADAAPARPNLVVSAVKWGPLTPVGGQQVRFTALVTNKGTAATPAGTITGVAFEVDGVKRTWSDTTTVSVQPGATLTLTANYGPTGSATWTATSGPHTLRAVVDDVNRIPESREDDNTLSAGLPVASGLSVRMGGPGLLVGMANLDRPTVLTTSFTGDLYAGCRTADGVLVDGSERYVGPFTFGRDKPAFGSKFNDGVVMVPAGVTQQSSGVDLFTLSYAYQGGLPFTCGAGQRTGWTVFNATSATVTRWPGQFGSDGPALAKVTTPLNTVLTIGS